jgi:hypothetical protein
VKLVKWRTGSEARISCLKRDYLWRRTLFDSLAGTQTWCGWGVLTHNSIKIAHLAISPDAKQQPLRPAGSDPPTSSRKRTAAA